MIMNRQHQKGIALFTTMILLVIVTLASVVLMRNAGFENKVSGAYAQQAIANGATNGAADEIIATARRGGTNPFIDDEVSYPKSESAGQFPSVSNQVDFVVETPGACQRSEDANSQNLDLVCRLLIMDSSLSYSRSNSGQAELATGIAHPLTN